MWFATSPVDEIGALTTGLSDRDRDLVLQWLGAHPSRPLAKGEARPTQSDLARAYRISRARVGQLVTRFKAAVEDWSIRLPWCERTLDRLQMQGGVAHASEVDGASMGSLHALVGASAIGALSAAVRYDRELETWTTDRGGTTVAAYRKQLRRSLQEVRRQRTQWGALRIDLLPAWPTLPPELRVRLALPSGASWTITDGLAVFSGARSTLVRVSEKALAVSNPFHLPDLHGAMDQQVRFAPPSLDELRAILSHHPEYDVDGLDWVTHLGELDLDVVLTPAERTAAEILGDADGVIDREGYVQSMERAGFAKELATAVLRSPFLVRLERGVYALRGVAAEPAQIRAARTAAVKRFRRSLDAVERHAGRLVMHYTLSHPCLTRGRLPCPASAGLPAGRWTASFPDGTAADISVRDGAVSGLVAWMRLVGAAVGSRLSLEVDERARTVHVTAHRAGSVTASPGLGLTPSA